MYVNKTDLALLAGGVVAAFETKTYDPVVTNVLECTNRGAVSITLTAESGDAYAAGVVATHRPLVDVSSCENFGSITSSSNASGIASAAIGITNSVNHGPVNGALSSHGIAFTISKTAVAIANTVCDPNTFSRLRKRTSFTATTHRRPSLKLVLPCTTPVLQAIG